MIGRLALFVLLSSVALVGSGRLALPAEEHFTNSLGMKFVRIEAGSFFMGGAHLPLPEELILLLSYPTTEELVRRFPQGDPSRFVINLDHVRYGDADEKPVHRVTVSKPFYMSVFEVTNAQYEQFDPSHRALRGKNGFSQENDEAVVFISWEEAEAFCRWLSRKEGRPYRLPTEAEWEYACRAGTTTPFFTGITLPAEFHKNQRRTEFTDPEKDRVDLRVGRTPPNPWGLHDMHGNVEEWCWDWYGPYEPGAQLDPVGRRQGDFKVTRGGSHGTNLYYLRSANRMGTLPENRHWLVGFRVVLAEMPGSEAVAALAPQPFQTGVDQKRKTAGPPGYDPAKPYFKGPRKYVKIPENSQGPLFSHHNHDPAIVDCPNGDLLAIWYTCVEERGRELAIAASRLRYGEEEWDSASLFWDAPDRNDHCPALWYNGEGTLYHFNGLSVAGMWEPLAVILRTSTDNGVTWSKARMIVPEHGFRQMVGEPVFQLPDGRIAFGADAQGGSTIWVGALEAERWIDPGGTIHGIHAAIAPLKDGGLLAFGRGMNIEGMMPKSISTNGGKTWSVGKSPFPPLRGGQRPVLLRLKEGPLFFASFADNIGHPKPGETDRRGRTSLFAALSFDEGETWPLRKIITDGRPDHRLETIDGGPIRISPSSSEPLGYLSVAQSVDGIIHLITSINHYAFNLAWLKTPDVSAAGDWPRAKSLEQRSRLASLYRPLALPTQGDPPWNYLGPGEESKTASVDGQALKIRSTARWSNERLPGLHDADNRASVTAEIVARILESAPERGLDLELFVRGSTLTVNHYLITITGSAVYYWYGGKFEKLIDGLNNTDEAHRFRLSIRPDTAVQIYRDGQLLAVKPMDLIIDWRAPARGSYLEWGLQGPKASAIIHSVAYDASGAFE